MVPTRVSVVIVSYNTREKLQRCLACLEAHHEVIVVDNASADGSADMVATQFPHVKLIRCDRNLGFGPANNLGCRSASQDLVLFLNSDAYADPGSIDTQADAFKDPNIVAAGGKLLNPDRSLQASTANNLTLWAVFCEQTLLEKAFPTSALLSPYWTTNRLAATDAVSRTAQVMGASLMVRANQGTPVEEFDERYFLYCEDTDLCLRLQRHGDLVYVPQATFVHDLGSSSAKDPSLGITRYNRGKELYFKINHGASASTVCLVMDRLGALLRLLIWVLMIPVKAKRAQSQAGCFWRVLTAPRI